MSDLKVDHPATPALQHELFEITDGTSEHRFRAYTNVMEMWDTLPKYDPYGSGTRYYKELDINESIRKYPVRHPTHREQFLSDEPSFVDIELHITPARIERRIRKDVNVIGDDGKKKRRRVYLRDDKGNYLVEPVYVYPGLREDKVHDALTYLLSHGQGQFDAERTGVTFSVKQVFNELRRTSSAMNMDEIKEALEVLSRARCEIYGLDADGKKRSVMGSPFLPNLVMVDRRTYEERRKEDTGKDFTHCYAQFHIAVTMSIQSNQFRISHYKKHQGLRNLLARFIHKILRTQFLNASGNGQPFMLSYNKLFTEFGRPEARDDKNLDLLKTALKELERVRIIEKSEIEDIKNLKDKRRKVDRKIHLYPSKEFIDEMIASNSRHKKNFELLADFTNTKAIAKSVNDLPPAHKRAHREMAELGVSSTRALEVLNQSNIGVVQQCLKETRLKMEKGKLDNPSGWFLSAIAEGYFGDAGFVAPAISEPSQKHLNRLPQHLQARILELWPSWDDSTRATFEKNGFNSPHIREQVGELN